jgi:CxxC motif-containing protein (DUF1111 family)
LLAINNTVAPASGHILQKEGCDDFQVHNMGAGLQDQVAQGYAAGNEFRTAPRWGLGQRIFYRTGALPI